MNGFREPLPSAPDRHKVRGDITLVEQHTLDNVKRRAGSLGLLNRNDAVLTDLVQRFRDKLTDFRVVVARDRGDLRNLLVVPDLDCVLFESRNRSLYRLSIPLLTESGAPPAAT
jgi:hypothetical protein